MPCILHYTTYSLVQFANATHLLDNEVHMRHSDYSITKQTSVFFFFKRIVILINSSWWTYVSCSFTTYYESVWPSATEDIRLKVWRKLHKSIVFLYPNKNKWLMFIRENICEEIQTTELGFGLTCINSVVLRIWQCHYLFVFELMFAK